MKDPISLIRSLDLQYLALRLIKQNWDPEEAQEAVRKYKNFLILKCLYPNRGLVPTYEIDEVWHSHILHTKNYFRDCEQMFGRYFHHHPASEGKQEKGLLRERYLETARLYKEEFKESYDHALDPSLWI